jgi:Ser/Thr protein kinase RdoA (MazF antagonist)
MLQDRAMDGAFSAVTLEYVGRFSNDVWRADLDNGIRLLIKIPHVPERTGYSLDLERRFYRCLAARPELPVPRYVGEIDGALILEYLELEPFSFRSGATAQHAEVAIDALADWHAAWWIRADQLDWLPDYADPALRQAMQTEYDAAWRGHGRRLLEYAPEFEAIGEALVGRLADTLAPMATPVTVIHGDAHAENVPLTPRGAVLLDWQDGMH